jgi:hypothetical protein
MTTKPATFAAFNGKREYDFTSSTGENFHGTNQDDASIVGFANSQPTGQTIVDFFIVHHLDPLAVMRAYDAVGDRGDASDLLKFPAVKAWYDKWAAKQYLLVPAPAPVKAPTPDPLIAEGQALVVTLADYILRLQAKLVAA